LRVIKNVKHISLLFSTEQFTSLFFTYKDSNQLRRKMIQRLKAKHHTLVTPAGQNSVNATQTKAKHAQRKLLQTHCKCFVESIIYHMQLTNHLIF